jgi:CHAT domain-containing protein
MAPATLESVQHGVLARDELLLAAWTGTERGWLVAVTRDTAVSVPLPADGRLARDVDLLRESIAAEPPLEPAALDAMLADGGRRWLGPLVPLLARCRRVVFVPAGSLQRLPLEALRVPLGRGGALVSLGETRALSRAPSASLLALARSRPRPVAAPDPALLVLANARGRFGTKGSMGTNGAKLPGALAEARELEARYRGTRLLERPRDPEAALQAMSLAGAVHVAAHAGFDPVSPWRSTLQLGEGEPVRARDVLGVRLRAELVVLSACETAGGSARGTGGMEGLGAAFLCVGARGVVATLWPVEDRAARRFVEIFYEEAERAPDVATALSRARVRFRASAPDALVRDWAAYTLVGDPGARLALARRSPPQPGIP